MAQHDYVIANANGATVRADINNALLAISSTNSGSSEPSTPYAYEMWVDTSNNLLKLRNAANDGWITLGVSITASNTVDINGGAIDGTPIGASSASTGAFSTLSTTDNLSIGGSNKELRFYEGSNYVGFEAPALTGDQIWVLPSADGSADQVLTTDGSGALSFSTVSGTTINSNADNRVITGSDSANTLNGETNLVFDGNDLGIGTTAPASAAGNTAGLHIKNSAPYIRLQDDTGTVADWEIYAFDDKLHFYDNTDSAIRMTIDGDGAVGLGDTSPDCKLVVSTGGSTASQGDTDLLVRHNSATGTTAQVQILAGNAGYSNLYLSDTDSYSVGGFIYNHSSNYLATNVNGSERMRLDSSGNVGIGVSPASAASTTRLHIANSASTAILQLTGAGVGTAATDGGEIACDDNGDFRLRNFESGNMQFFNNGSEAMRIDSSGDLGVGTDNPYAKINAAGHIRAENSAFLGGREDAGNPTFSFHDDSDTGMFNVASNILCFATGGSERMRIDSSGLLCVGRTSTLNDAVTLEVDKGSADGNSLVVVNAYSGGRVFGIQSRFSESTNDTGYLYSGYQTNGTNLDEKFSVKGDGTVGSATNTYGGISDLKLKQDISDSSSQWEDVKAIKVRKYRMKNLVAQDSSAPYFLGVIAQELETAGMNNLVYENDDVDADMVDQGTTTKHVKYSILYMKAVKALQEAQTRIETLEAKVEALESA